MLTKNSWNHKWLIYNIYNSEYDASILNFKPWMIQVLSKNIFIYCLDFLIDRTITSIKTSMNEYGVNLTDYLKSVSNSIL